MERKNKKMALNPPKILELKKHVAVIHSSNKLTLLQRKIANALLFNAYSKLLEKDEHTIHIAKLCELIGYDSNDHKSIKRALINLLSTVLEWNLVDGERSDDKEGIWNASSIIADASINGAICTYSYSNRMKNLLYRPNMYGRLDMLVQAKFQSGYGLALYENCNRFQNIGQTPSFNLPTFRKLMGVEDGKYKIFRDFKTRVLDKAVEEVNKYSSLIITPQLRKQNRQVTSIQFFVKKLSNLVVDPGSKNLDEGKLANILRSQFSFSSKQVIQIINQYEEKYIEEKINIIKSSSSYKSGKVKNLTQYLISALRDDYQISKDNVSTDRNNNPKNYLNNIKLCLDPVKLTKFQRYQDEVLFEAFKRMLEKDKINVLQKFNKFLSGVYLDVYSRSGLENILVQEKLCTFLRKTNHPLVTKLITYDGWLKEIEKA